jgi:hypothetical protein
VKGIPEGFRADDFSLSIVWMASGGEDDPLPGFRLEAMFSNEGEAYSVLSNSRVNWKHRVRLKQQTLQNVFTTLAVDPGVPSELMNLGNVLNEFTENRQRSRIAGMVTKTRQLREQLAAAEAALEAEGLPRDA